MEYELNVCLAPVNTQLDIKQLTQSFFFDTSEISSFLVDEFGFNPYLFLYPATLKSVGYQASKYLKIGTCPASQKLLAYMEKCNFHYRYQNYYLPCGLRHSKIPADECYFRALGIMLYYPPFKKLCSSLSLYVHPSVHRFHSAGSIFTAAKRPPF